MERGVKRNRIPFDYTDAHDVLSRLGLLCDDGMLTNATAVCFVPSRDTMLRMGVFADSKRVDILDNQQVTGTLFSMVDAAELYILNNIRRAFIIDGSSLHREERPEIPRSAIREALFNAFCHRDYEDEAAIQVDIFWNAVDIYSPGLFPSGLTPEDYLSGEVTASKPRNQLIAATLYKSGDIETYGTGLQRIKSACDEQGVPVEVSQRGGSVHVRFTRSGGIAAANSPTSADNRRQTADKSNWGGLAESDRRVCEYLSEYGTASVTEASQALGIPQRTLRDVMRRLVEKEIVVASGANKNRRYSLR